MPANLPPQYFEAEKRFRVAKSVEDKVMALEEMLAIMPKHKGTDHLKAELRHRIAKLTQEAEKKSGTKRSSLLIEKEGAAQVAVIGMPNAGKSQLVSSITNASSSVAEYPFTTCTAIPGMMEFENIQIQLIDTPPFGEQPVEWWLRHLIIRADALLLVIDLAGNPLAQVEKITEHLTQMRVGIGNPKPVEGEDIILSYKKALIVGNKIDQDGTGNAYLRLKKRYAGELPVTSISAKMGTSLEELRYEVYRMLDIIRVYTKAPGQKPEMNAPIVLEKGSTLADAAESVHKDFRAKLKYARIWGSGKHDGVMAKRNHVLQDGDVIELHL
ncbi:MAG: 50S ribosome-binding GTPase [Dehalococcoidales bacterium]|nr:50S ribosome-binding GTPase [Dehalococcoidales bacterium]